LYCFSYIETAPKADEEEEEFIFDDGTDEVIEDGTDEMIEV